MTECTNCHAALGESAQFCSTCGTPVGKVSAIDVLRSAKSYVCDAADDMIDAGKDVVGTDLGKKMAAGAAVGALAVAPIPVIGWAAGALVGAGLVAFKHAAKKA